MAKVMIYPSTYETITEAVEQVFARFPLDMKGKKVLIKPNVLRASEAREGSSPIRRCCARWLKEPLPWAPPHLS